MSVRDVMDVVRARAGTAVEREVAGDERPRGDAEIEGLLRQIDLLARTPQIDHRLGWKTPIVGHAWLIFRRRLHQEIRIYVDLLTRQQTSFNVGVARILAVLVERSRGPADRRIAALEAEVASLRREVAELRASLGGAAGSTARAPRRDE